LNPFPKSTYTILGHPKYSFEAKKKLLILKNPNHFKNFDYPLVFDRANASSLRGVSKIAGMRHGQGGM
jgi:hypothetical protein